MLVVKLRMATVIAVILLASEATGLGKYRQISNNVNVFNDDDESMSKSGGNFTKNNNGNVLESYRFFNPGGGGGGRIQSIETLAAALLIGLFAFFIVTYAICLQCCWNNSNCPFGLAKESDEGNVSTFCPCVEGMASSPEVEFVASGIS